MDPYKITDAWEPTTDEAEDLAHARHEGHEAFHAGGKQSDNPYRGFRNRSEFDAELFAEWDRGFDRAFDAAEELAAEDMAETVIVPVDVLRGIVEGCLRKACAA